MPLGFQQLDILTQVMNWPAWVINYMPGPSWLWVVENKSYFSRKLRFRLSVGDTTAKWNLAVHVLNCLWNCSKSIPYWKHWYLKCYFASFMNGNLLDCVFGVVSQNDSTKGDHWRIANWMSLYEGRKPNLKGKMLVRKQVWHRWHAVAI